MALIDFPGRLAKVGEGTVVDFSPSVIQCRAVGSPGLPREKRILMGPRSRPILDGAFKRNIVTGRLKWQKNFAAKG
jgi:hypothetical protein